VAQVSCFCRLRAGNSYVEFDEDSRGGSEQVLTSGLGDEVQIRAAKSTKACPEYRNPPN
jgi:hypothetical protein